MSLHLLQNSLNTILPLLYLLLLVGRDGIQDCIRMLLNDPQNIFLKWYFFRRLSSLSHWGSGDGQGDAIPSRKTYNCHQCKFQEVVQGLLDP